MSNCRRMRYVSIPYSVTEAEFLSLCNCQLLDRITFPKTVSRIGEASISNCMSVRLFCFPDGITEIGNSCLQGMNALQKVEFGNAQIESIGTSAFNECTSLGTIEIPETVTRIKDQAFAKVNCKSIFVYPKEPPNLKYNNTFQGIWSDCVIYVPHGCLAAYQAATNWSDYASHMVEMPE